MAHIATKAGVTKMTVSKALRNAPDISLSTRKKIQTLAKKLYYSPNAWALHFRQKSTRTIGVILPDIDHSFFPEIVIALEKTLRQNGYETIVAHSEGNPQRELDLLENFLSRRTDGVAIAPNFFNSSLEKLYLHLNQQNYPLIFIDREVPTKSKIPVVSTDDWMGMQLLIDHLVKLGHRKILHLTGLSGISTAEIRQQAFIHALQKHQLKPHAIVKSGFFVEDGLASASHIIRKYSRALPTAIVAPNDLNAIGLIHGLLKKGVRVPEDLSVTGYSGLRWGQFTQVPLTTIIQPVEKMGQQVAHQLLQKIQGKKTKTQFLPVTLSIRSSTTSPAMR